MKTSIKVRLISKITNYTKDNHKKIAKKKLSFQDFSISKATAPLK